MDPLILATLSDYGIAIERLMARPQAPDMEILAGPSSAAEILSALQQLAPRRCGIDLVRLGGDLDGGYLLPDDLAGIEACFSPGTNNFKRFEDELYHRHGIRSYMCDFSSDESLFQTPLIAGAQFFEKKWLDSNGGPDALDLTEWVKSNTVSDELLLQMDIEGAEYRNLLAAGPGLIQKFRIIVLELHDLQRLGERAFLNGVFLPAMASIAAGHVPVHVHPNNCCGQARLAGGVSTPCAIEITFLRKDRMRPEGQPLVVPHPLDQLNVRREPPIALTGPWLVNADQTQSRIAILEQTVGWLTDRVTTLAWHNAFLVARAQLGGNVALGKRATQSSISPYSTADDASGAVSGIRTGGFGFHTDEDHGPWWMIDLGLAHRLDHCLVFNRMDCASVRADGLRIECSTDGQQWILVYEHAGDRPTFGGMQPHDGEPALLVSLGGTVARFVRLSLAGVAILHLDEVEVFGAPLD